VPGTYDLNRTDFFSWVTGSTLSHVSRKTRGERFGLHGLGWTERMGGIADGFS